jgi:hypothetical protein
MVRSRGFEPLTVTSSQPILEQPTFQIRSTETSLELFLAQTRVRFETTSLVILQDDR